MKFEELNELEKERFVMIFKRAEIAYWKEKNPSAFEGSIGEKFYNDLSSDIENINSILQKC